MRITLDAKYPDIIDEVKRAIQAVCPGNRVGTYSKQGSLEIWCYSQGWPDFFPQHGLGEKHLRDIALAPWQQEIVDAYPEAFLRGLIHSDGCRFNVVQNGICYTRYQFSNRSTQIRRLFCQACERVGVRYNDNHPKNTTVQHRQDVVRFDAFIGPKS